MTRVSIFMTSSWWTFAGSVLKASVWNPLHTYVNQNHQSHRCVHFWRNFPPRFPFDEREATFVFPALGYLSCAPTQFSGGLEMCYSSGL